MWVTKNVDKDADIDEDKHIPDEIEGDLLLEFPITKFSFCFFTLQMMRNFL